MNSVAEAGAMVNEGYEPAPEQEEIIELLKEGRDTGEPWGRTNLAHIRKNTSIAEGNVSYHLNQLSAAGWIEREARGLYEFVEDPRE